MEFKFDISRGDGEREGCPAAYLKDRLVSTSDIYATIYHWLGIDPAFRVSDQSGRPVEIAHGGMPIHDILA